MGGLVGFKTAFRGRSGDGPIVIREHHAFRDTDKERCDLVFAVLEFRRRHGNNRNRRCSVEVAGKQREILVLSRSQRLEGADVFGVKSVELVSARIELEKRVRPKGEAALFDASLTNSTRCSCDDPSGLASAFGIGTERRIGFEVEVPLDRQPETAAMRLEDAEPN